MSNTYYTKDHEWLTINDEIATVGITDHAQETLGEIVFVELPEIGQDCQKGETVAVVESVKAASDIYSPITGEVIEVNNELDDSPEMMNDAAETTAWIMKVRLKTPLEKDEYMNHEDYLNSIDA